MPRTAAILTTVTCVCALAGARVYAGQGPTAPESATSLSSVFVAPADGGFINVQFLPDRFVATATTLHELILHAYDLQAWEIGGGPDWVRVDRFNVAASNDPPVATSRERMKAMLRSLLSERFELRLVRETRPGTVYRMSARNVRNLRPTTRPGDEPTITARRLDSFGGVRFSYDARNVTMRALTRVLSKHLQAPVVDDTLLTGAYDFRITYTEDDVFGNQERDANVPPIDIALEKQLGLELAATNGPVPVYRIDRASRPLPK